MTRRPAPTIGNPIGLVAPLTPLTPEQEAQALAEARAEAHAASIARGHAASIARALRDRPPVGASINTNTVTPIGS